MLLMVTMLNSVPLPLTNAFCNSAGVIVPDLFASTLKENMTKISITYFLPFKVSLQLGLPRHVWRWRGGPSRLEI